MSNELFMNYNDPEECCFQFCDVVYHNLMSYMASIAGVIDYFNYFLSFQLLQMREIHKKMIIIFI